jgi:hypothetical protein
VLPVCESAIAIELSSSSVKGSLLCSVQRGAQGIGLVDDVTASMAGGASLQTLRALLEGARLEGFSRVGSCWW